MNLILHLSTKAPPEALFWLDSISEEDRKALGLKLWLHQLSPTVTNFRRALEVHVAELGGEIPWLVYLTVTKDLGDD